MKTIVIDRSKWRTGSFSKHATGEGSTELQNSSGFMCCLGFITKAHKKKTKNCSMPSSTNCKIPNLTVRVDDPGEPYRDTELAGKAATINDNEKLTLKQKEAALKKLFKGIYKLEFVGKPVAYKS